jgi:hypothetical protein
MILLCLRSQIAHMKQCVSKIPLYYEEVCSLSFQPRAYFNTLEIMKRILFFVFSGNLFCSLGQDVLYIPNSLSNASVFHATIPFKDAPRFAGISHLYQSGDSLATATTLISAGTNLYGRALYGSFC